MQQEPVQQVKSDVRPCMTKMGITVNSWATDIHADFAFNKWFKNFLLMRKSVKNNQLLFHFIGFYKETKVKYLNTGLLFFKKNQK